MLKLTESAIGMLVSQYRAVLKNMRIKGAALALTGCLLLAPSSVAMAEDDSGNTVNINNEVVAEDVIGGDAYSENGAAIANNNTVNITNRSEVTGNISGGDAESDKVSATANNNTINITDSEVTGYIEGGFAASVTAGTANNNTVEINSSTITPEHIVGGAVWSGSAGAVTANGNTVAIIGTEVAVVENDVEFAGIAGGYAWSEGAGAATANDNTLDITDSTITGGIAGGAADSYEGTGTANNNTVNITDATITTSIEGGIFGGVVWSEGAAMASGNIVNITGGTVTGDIEGGSAESNTGPTTANNNTVNINGANIITMSDEGVSGDGAITGGGASSAERGTGTASYNTINITNSTIDGAIEGGFAFSNITATLNNNTVNITDSAVSNGSIYGAHNFNPGRPTGVATATNNTVDISGGTITADVVNGADIFSVDDTVTANKNKVNINGSSITIVTAHVDDEGGITGGFADSETGSTTANENIVNITNATINNGAALGGGADSVEGTSTANNNTVTITNSTINGDVVGGSALGGIVATANNNTVNINSDGTIINGDVAGGLAESNTGTTTANNNTVNINGGRVNGTVYGGLGSGDVFTGNTLNINSEPVRIADVENFEFINFNYTGQANIDTLVIGTQPAPITTFSIMPFSSSPLNVILNTNNNNIDFNGQISGTGDLTKTGSGNLTLSGGNTNDIIGNLDVNSGGLYISDTTKLSVDGTATFANGTTLGVGNTAGALDANDISIGSNVALDITAAGNGTNSVITFSNNINGNFSQFLVGGVAIGQGSEPPSLERFLNVSVDVKATGIDVISNGYAWNSTANETAHGNFFVKTKYTLDEKLSDNTTTTAYFAGWDGKTLTKTGEGRLVLTNGANDYTGNTNINSGTLVATDVGALGVGTEVNISENSGLEFTLDSDGTFSKQILGMGNLTKTGTGELTLSGENTYTGLTELREGTLSLTGAGTISDKLSLYSGTTFNTGGNTVDYLSLVNAYGNAQWNGDLHTAGKTMNFYLPETTGNGDTMLTVSGNADITNSTVNVGIQGSSSLLQKEDSVILIDANTLSGMPINETSNGQGMQGVTLRYEFDIATEANQLLATVKSVGTTEQSKSLSEGKLSGLVSVNHGQDFIADQGIGNAVHSAKGQGTSPFAAIGYGNTRHKTGSHIDSNGWSMIVGVAKENPNNGTTYGVFLEGGRGNYDTFNSFASGDVNGSGKNRYFGGGVLLRNNGQDNGSSYNYHEGSLRLGRVTTDFSSNVTDLGFGDTKSTYYGAHYGFGQVKKQNSGAIRDLYGKLFYTHQGGDSITLNDGNHMDFSSAKSLRARLGILFITAPSASGTSFSYGLAYEHEFDGKQEATINTVAVDAPSMKGGSAIGTIGLNHQKAGSNFSMGLDLNGYVGKRQGLGVNAKFKWAF